MVGELMNIKKIVFVVLGMCAMVCTITLIWLRQRGPSIDLMRAKESLNVVPFAVIGSGPAGLSAALYGARLGLPTVVFAGPEPGGQLTETGMVENWPGAGVRKGPEIMQTLREQATKAGALIAPLTIKSVNINSWPFELVSDDGQHIHALTIVVATGSAPRVLDVPGERQYWGKGVTNCALCDAPYYRGKDVVVVGGGDSAVEEACALAVHARTVTVLVRGKSMRASRSMQDRLTGLANVRVRTGVRVRAIEGDGHWVTGIQLVAPSASVPSAGMFLAIGQEPRSSLFVGQLKLDKQGYIELRSGSQCTSVAGVYAAGDVADAAYRQAGVAAGAGIKAAIEAFSWLQSIGYRSIEQAVQAHVYEVADTGPSQVRTLTSVAEYERETHGSLSGVPVPGVPVSSVLDFYTQQCPACHHMMPIFEYVAHKLHEKVHFFKIDGQAVPELAQRFGVTRVPCFIVVKNGKVVARAYELMDKPKMMEFVQKAIA